MTLGVLAKIFSVRHYTQSNSRSNFPQVRHVDILCELSDKLLYYNSLNRENNLFGQFCQNNYLKTKYFYHETLFSHFYVIRCFIYVKLGP